jgi:hypothetical protein
MPILSPLSYAQFFEIACEICLLQPGETLEITCPRTQDAKYLQCAIMQWLEEKSTGLVLTEPESDQP